MPILGIGADTGSVSPGGVIIAETGGAGRAGAGRVARPTAASAAAVGSGLWFEP